MVKGITMKEQSRQESSSDDKVYVKNSPRSRKKMTKSELKKAYAEIDSLRVECETDQETIVQRKEFTIACFFRRELEAKEFVNAIVRQNVIETNLSDYRDACCRALYLVGKQIEEAK
jgi:hypothetical protein